MSYGFKIIAEGNYACYTRPEMKVERVSYDVPTPGAIEGMLKSIYWKPAVRYIVDKIIVYNPIDFVNIRRNELKEKVSYKKVKNQMKGGDDEPDIFASDDRTQRAAMVLKNVKYGIEFHFELTGLKCENEMQDPEKKHYNIIKRRLEKGQYFRSPCLGCCEFPAKKIELVEDFDLSVIDPIISKSGDVDLGFMCYRVNFKDNGVPINNDWDNPKFSDEAIAQYYRPHMINGVIDVKSYREVMKC